MAGTTLLFRFLGIDDGAGAEFDKMSAKTDALGGASGRALKAARMLADGIAATGVVVAGASVDLAAKFQTSMTRCKRRRNVSAKNVEILSDGILNMAGSVAETPNELALRPITSRRSARSRWTTAQQLKVLQTATEGAKLGGADLVDVTNALDAAIVSTRSAASRTTRRRWAS